MKTITIEEIYADPHVLEPLLASPDSVKIVRSGRQIATLTPENTPNLRAGERPFTAREHRAWFLKTYGPEAFQSERSVEEIITYARD